MKQKVEDFLNQKLGLKIGKQFKVIFLLSTLLLIGIIEIFIYWNSHVYHKARRQEDEGRKIKVLRKAIPFFPSNDLVYYERGRAHLERALNNIQNEGVNAPNLQQSIKSLRKAIKINPASQFSHFYLAQSLLYESFVSPSSDLNILDEFKKAAILAGNNSQIFFEVGKIFLTRWPQISNEDKEFALEILRKVLSRKNKEDLRTILQIWEMNVNNYEIMEQLLPQDAEVYRIYAEFLGEKSLSLEERHRALARAEFMDFERANYEYSIGENDLFNSRLESAFDHFQSCLKTLQRIKFYQSLTQQNQIELSEFRRLLKSTNLNLAKCLIAHGGGLKAAEVPLREYLSLEDKISPLSDLENYLVYQGLMDEELGTSFDDLDRLSIQLYLYFRQNKYREIIKLGTFLLQSVVVVPPSQKQTYIDILRIIGDSCHRVDQLYDAAEFYRRALESDPDDLQTLIRIRRNCERLNEEDKIEEINQNIKELLSPNGLELKLQGLLEKGDEYTHTLILDGQEINLQLHFMIDVEKLPSLVSIDFNGHVVWEDSVKFEIVSIPLSTNIGENILRVRVIDRAISLVRLQYEPRLPTRP